MTPLLQWLDVVIHKPFKDMLKDFWEEWLDTGRAEFTKSGNRKRASYELIANWVMEASNRIATDEKILTSFRQYGYIDYDGKVENFHSKLHMTIKNREVPYEPIEEINAFVDEMKALDDKGDREKHGSEDELEDMYEMEMEMVIESGEENDDDGESNNEGSGIEVD